MKTTFAELQAALAGALAHRDERLREEAQARRESTGEAEIERLQARLADPEVVRRHVEAEYAACNAEDRAIVAEDAPLNRAVDEARAALQDAERRRESERHRLRHEARREAAFGRRAAAKALLDRATFAAEESLRPAPPAPMPNGIKVLLVNRGEVMDARPRVEVRP